MLKLRSLYTIDSMNRSCVVKYNTFSAHYAQELDFTGYLTHARYGKIIDISLIFQINVYVKLASTFFDNASNFLGHNWTCFKGVQ